MVVTEKNEMGKMRSKLSSNQPHPAPLLCCLACGVVLLCAMLHLPHVISATYRNHVLATCFTSISKIITARSSTHKFVALSVHTNTREFVPKDRQRRGSAVTNRNDTMHARFAHVANPCFATGSRDPARDKVREHTKGTLS